MINKYFLGCNYNDISIKKQFDNVKIRLEKEYPIICQIINKREDQAARDLWQVIKKEIEDSSICFFDVSAFRPNVILELGYAIAVKDNSNIFITFRNRKKDGEQPVWSLSDIGHLNRFQYKNISELERFIKDKIISSSFFSSLEKFYTDCENETSAQEKYKKAGNDILFMMRNYHVNESNIRRLIQGTHVQSNKIISLLKKHRLIQPYKDDKHFIMA